MAILHRNITNSSDIHNPKWFPDSNNGDYAFKNEKGELESTDELLLPAALNFVDGSVAPPTTATGDIYILSSGGSVNAGWGSVSLQDWVRYDGDAWNSLTPQKSSLCYDKTADSLMSFDGSAWNAIGGGGGGNTIYTADDTIGSNRVATITDNLTFRGSSSNNVLNLAHTGEMQFSAGGTMYGKMFSNGDWALGSNTIIGVQAGICLHRNVLCKSESNTASNTPFQVVNTSNSGIFQVKGDGRAVLGSNSFLGSEKILCDGKTFIKGADTLSTSSALQIYDGDGTPNLLFTFKNSGTLNMSSIPTSSAGLLSGDVYNDSGTLKIV